MTAFKPHQRDNSSPLCFAAQAGSVYHFAMNKKQYTGIFSLARRDTLESAGYQVGGSSDLGKDYVLNFQFSGQSQRSSGRSRLELRGDSSSGRQLSVAIEDAPRNRLWRARIDLRASKADDIALADTVMPALIAKLGCTVYALRVP